MSSTGNFAEVPLKEEDEVYANNPPDLSWIETILDEPEESEKRDKKAISLVESNYDLFGINGHKIDDAATHWLMNRFFKREESKFSDWTNKSLEAPAPLEETATGAAGKVSLTREDVPGEFENSSVEEKCSFELWRGSVWNSSYDNMNPAFGPFDSICCYMEPGCQYLGAPYFYLDGGFSCSLLPTMKIAVLDPLQRETPLYIFKENLPLSRRYICRFPALFPGHYTVTVWNGLLNRHVIGSPFTIPISRNYATNSFMSREFFSYAFKPWGVAYSNQTQRIYVTDRYSNRVIVFHANGILDKSFGKGGSKEDEFCRPTGIAVDNRYQRLIITDKDNHRVCVYTFDGEFVYGFGREGHKNGEFSYPWGVAVSYKDSSIAIADSKNYRIQLFDCNGMFLRKFSVHESTPYKFKTEFNYPRGIVFDNNGEDMYVTDNNIQTVFKLNFDLTQKTKVYTRGPLFKRPHGITVDAVGNILVCDCHNNCIRVINPKGEHINTITGANMQLFSFPHDVAVTPSGEIIVVDASSKIRVI